MIRIKYPISVYRSDQQYNEDGGQWMYWTVVGYRSDDHYENKEACETNPHSSQRIPEGRNCKDNTSLANNRYDEPVNKWVAIHVS